jgi:hypothetical protein
MKPYLFNGRFRVTAGAQFFNNGRLNFGVNPTDTDGTYRTLFGPVFSAGWTCYRECDSNVSLALCRLLGCIEANAFNDAVVRAFQGISCRDHMPVLRDFFAGVAHFFDDFVNCLDSMQEHVTDPHIKRDLRIRTHQEMLEEGKLERHFGTQSRRTVKAKMKKQEKAKARPVDLTKEKWPRMIFDVGCDASLVGSVLLGMVKEAMAFEPMDYLGCLISFVKSPEPQVLASTFHHLIHPTRPMEFVCFSDDAAMNMHIGNARVKMNTDISQADASYTPELFEQAHDILPPNTHHTFRRLIDQCKLSFKVFSCGDRKIFVVFSPTGVVLYSGSTLTTFLNTLANFNIAMAFAEALADGLITKPDDLIGIARAAGYIITIDVCEYDEDLQFLKHSPVLGTDGNWHPLLNAGVLLRASGMCMGDLPGSGDIATRGLAFQRGLLQGAYPYAHFQLLDALHASAGIGEVHLSKEFQYKVIGSYPQFRVDEASFLRRYRSNQHELNVLCEFIMFGLGYSVHSRLSESILSKDYGLSAQEYQRPNFFFGPERE